MVSTIVIDISEELYAKNIAVINQLQTTYEVITNKKCENTKGNVVILDAQAKVAKWEGYAIIAVETLETIYGVSYVVESLAYLDEELVEKAYCRYHNLPYDIAMTDRLLIREFEENDWKELMDICAGEETVSFINSQMDEISAKETLRNYAQNMYAFYEYGLWAVVERATGKIIGCAGIEHREINGILCCELGYVIGKEYRRNGYALEACNAIVNYASHIGIECLFLYIDEKNAPSLALAHKLGFDWYQEQQNGASSVIVYKKELFA